MKVIKIKKHSRNHTGIFYIMLEDYKCIKEEGSIWEDNIDYYADERCYKDGAGHSYGWKYEWEFVTNKIEIKSIVENELELLKNKAEKITEKMNELNELL